MMSSNFSNKSVIIDTGPLIAFAHLNLLPEIVQLFNAITITEQVFLESQVEPERIDAQIIKDAVSNKLIQVTKVYIDLGKYPASLGLGEISTIESVKNTQCIVVLDDKQARQYARECEVDIIGTAGVLLYAKRMKIIDSVMPQLEKLRNRQYYFSDDLIKKIKQLAGEG